jgi:hypothetical protein
VAEKTVLNEEAVRFLFNEEKQEVTRLQDRHGQGETEVLVDPGYIG